MYTNILKNIHYLFINPRRFFKAVTSRHTPSLKQLISLVSICFVLMTILEIFNSNILLWYPTMPVILIYILGFIAGLTVRYLFKIYFLTMLINKNQKSIDYKQTGSIVMLASITDILLFVTFLIFPSIAYNTYITLIFLLWNLILTTIGVMLITNIKWKKATFYVIVTLAAGMIIKLAFTGISI